MQPCLAWPGSGSRLVGEILVLGLDHVLVVSGVWVGCVPGVGPFCAGLSSSWVSELGTVSWFLCLLARRLARFDSDPGPDLFLFRMSFPCRSAYSPTCPFLDLLFLTARQFNPPALHIAASFYLTPVFTLSYITACYGFPWGTALVLVTRPVEGGIRLRGTHRTRTPHTTPHQ